MTTQRLMKINTAAPNIENHTIDQFFAEPHDSTVVENHTVAQNVETGFKFSHGSPLLIV